MTEKKNGSGDWLTWACHRRNKGSREGIDGNEIWLFEGLRHKNKIGPNLPVPSSLNVKN